MTTKTRFIPIAALLVVLGAAFAGGSSLLTWASATWTNDVQGEFDTTATGGDAAQALIPLAVAALAALGAVLASRGWLRRAVGVLIALAGATVGWQGISGLLTAPTAALTPVNRPASVVGDARLDFWGPAVATLGGLLLIVAGVLVVLAPATTRVVGSRYERGPTTAVGTSNMARSNAVAPAAATGGDPRVDADLDAVSMWKAMDADQDPTSDDAVPLNQADTAGRPNGSTGPLNTHAVGPPTDGVAIRPPEER